jgi:hypothetical protein
VTSYPERMTARPEGRAEPKKTSGWLNLHPATGGLVLALDWLLFSGEALSLGTATPLTATLGGLATALATYRIQSKMAGDLSRPARLKAILAGVVVALPFPVGGTILGTMILASSGLNRLRSGR